MRMTVVGRHGPYPAPGGATSGYLLEHGNTSVLIDCGSGVLSRLGRFFDYNALAAVLLTHLHADHTADVPVLRYAIEADIRAGRRGGALPVYAVGEPAEEWRRLEAQSGLAVRQFDAGERFAIGELSFAFAPTVHAYPGVAVRVVPTAGDAPSFVFSGDTSPSAELANLAAGAELFLCESSWPRPQDAVPGVGHTSAVEAGRLAARAGVGRLLLTHLNPRHDADELLRLASAEWAGPVEVAREGGVYEVGA